jgi:glutaredoxin 3
MITVYTKNNCPYCDQAKSLLDSKGVAYASINIEEHPEARELIVGMGLRSVPQIFKEDTLLPGGFQGLAAQTDEFWTSLKG